MEIVRFFAQISGGSIWELVNDRRAGASDEREQFEGSQSEELASSVPQAVAHILKR